MLHIDVKQFLQENWQKQPGVIRKGLPNFVDPLDEHDLAGLAQLEEADSRIVSLQDAKWQLTQGPFEEFESSCVGNWSLLVQGVNQYIQEASYLLDEFSFIPNWRVDDLMVSFSVANAGVGPHIDQYDVFIIQGKGTRRWQVGPKGKYQETLPHPKLRQIEAFEPIIDEILEPGDIIYIPPGFPHNGVALENCMNYSVGFRAPDQFQLIDSFLNYCIEHNIMPERYADPDITARPHSAEISSKEINAVRKLMNKALDSESFENWFLTYNTELPCSEDSSPDDEGINDLTEISLIEKAPNTLCGFIESKHEGQINYAVNGKQKQFKGNKQEVESLKALLSNRQFNTENIPAKLSSEVLSWIKQGFWEIAD